MFTDSLYDAFFEHLSVYPDSDIAIFGNYATNNHEFLKKISENEIFSEKNILVIDSYKKKEIAKIFKKNAGQKFDYIFIFSEIFDIFEIKNILKEEKIVAKLIFASHDSSLSEDISRFQIEEFSFREFSKKNDAEFGIGDILKKSVDLEHLENLAKTYLECGSFAKNLDDNSEISKDFEMQKNILIEEIFEKEKEEFAYYIRILASNISELYKEDAIAKSMDISRRKAKKFFDLLVKHDIIRVLTPFVENPDKELSRHEKVFFSDLSYLKGAMGEGYNLGNHKLAVMQNFIFLELSRKLDTSHEIYFWRKKSGTEISFLLKNKNTDGLTPIEVTLRSHKNISATMKSFAESYGERIEHAMSLTEGEIRTTTIDEKSFFTLPFYTI